MFSILFHEETPLILDELRYNLLFETGILGGLKESENLEKEFFTLLRNKHTGILPPSEDSHPFIILAEPGICPPNYRKELIEFLKSNLISNNLVLQALPNFFPDKDEEETVKNAITTEILRVKEGWEQDRKARIPIPVIEFVHLLPIHPRMNHIHGTG